MCSFLYVTSIPSDEYASQSYPNIPMIRKLSTILPLFVANLLGYLTTLLDVSIVFWECLNERCISLCCSVVKDQVQTDTWYLFCKNYWQENDGLQKRVKKTLPVLAIQQLHQLFPLTNWCASILTILTLMQNTERDIFLIFRSLDLELINTRSHDFQFWVAYYFQSIQDYNFTRGHHQTKTHQTRTDQTKQDQTRPNKTKQDQTKLTKKSGLIFYIWVGDILCHLSTNMFMFTF